MSVEDQELRNAGLKVTLPRIKILKILEEAEDTSRHMSAEDVYKVLLKNDDDVGLATVYRVLVQFESAGLVTRHKFDDTHAVFELSKYEHHDHMICIETGKVIEFTDPKIEKLQHAIAEQHGYELIYHSLVLHVQPKKK